MRPCQDCFPFSRSGPGPALALLLIGLAGSATGVELGPAPGDRIALGSYRLHLDCRGSGSPTVVLESGLGEPALVWDEVQSRLSDRYRVCAYDRGGYGWSDAGPEPRTAAQGVAELRTLLEVGAAPAPYILVGHSYGGYLVQLFARQYPGLTAGGVLVDAAHPDQVDRLRADRPGLPTAPTGEGDLAWITFPDPPRALSPSQRHRMRLMQSGSPMREAVISELLHFRESGQQVLSSRPFPPVPLVVLSREGPDIGASPRERRLGETWMAMQRDLAGLSPRSRHLVVSRSGHDIHLDRPGAVVRAVQHVAREHRQLRQDGRRLQGQGGAASSGEAAPGPPAVGEAEATGEGQ